MIIKAHYTYEGARPPLPGVHICVYVGSTGTLSFGIGRWEPDIHTGEFGWVTELADSLSPVPFVVLEVEGNPYTVLKELQSTGGLTLLPDLPTGE